MTPRVQFHIGFKLVTKTGSPTGFKLEDDGILLTNFKIGLGSRELNLPKLRRSSTTRMMSFISDRLHHVCSDLATVQIFLARRHCSHQALSAE